MTSFVKKIVKPTPSDWVPDSMVKQCQVCDKTFSQRRRKHHCRKCGYCVCAECSSSKLPQIRGTKEKMVRVCDNCFNKNNLSKKKTNKSSTTAQKNPTVSNSSSVPETIPRRAYATSAPIRPTSKSKSKSNESNDAVPLSDLIGNSDDEDFIDPSRFEYAFQSDSEDEKVNSINIDSSDSLRKGLLDDEDSDFIERPILCYFCGLTC